MHNAANWVPEPVVIQAPGGVHDVIVSQAACGAQHTLLLDASGAVYCAGSNTWGQCAAHPGVAVVSDVVTANRYSFTT